jgi:hypothetical protein
MLLVLMVAVTAVLSAADTTTIDTLDMKSG